MTNRPTVRQKRLARRGFCWNAFWWGLGNGLVSTSLVVYIISALAAGTMGQVSLGLAISSCIAAPRLVGCLRLLTPSLIDRLGSRKSVCFWSYLISPLILALLPATLPLLSRLGTRHLNPILLFVGLLWAGYHLVEYFGTVALWSWLGDSVCGRARARFLAVRERCMIVGQFPGMLFCGCWTWYHPNRVAGSREEWVIYMVPALLGIVCLTAAAFPLRRIVEIGWRRTTTFLDRVRQGLAPFRDPRFQTLMLFSCWIQLAGGLVQGPQNLVQMNVLGISMMAATGLQSVTRTGQMLTAGLFGRALDRFGSIRVMACSLLLVSTGSLFYAAADPDTWYWIILSALVWICWLGVNLGIQNRTLELAPQGDRSAWIATSATLSTLTFGVATLAGGWLWDTLGHSTWQIPGTTGTIRYDTLCFVAVSFMRLAGLLFLVPFRRTTTS